MLYGCFFSDNVYQNMVGILQVGYDHFLKNKKNLVV